MMELPLKRSFDEAYPDAYERIDEFKHHLERIRNAKILVVGVGAIGNELVKNLAMFDVGHLFLCDMDTVEWANLSHSVLFRKEHDGKLKAEAAAETIRQMNPRVQVTPLPMPLSEIGAGIWRSMDLVVGCLDNRGSRLALDRICARVGKDWIDAGLGSLVPREDGVPVEGIMIGVIQRFSPRRGYAYEYYLEGAEIREAAEREASMAAKAFRNWMGCGDMLLEIQRHHRIPTTPNMASMVGALQAQEALRMLCPGIWGKDPLDGSRLEINLSRFTFSIVQHPEGPGMPAIEGVVQVPEFSAARTTLRELIDRAKADLGPHAVVKLGFQYCRGLACSGCLREWHTPFKLGWIDAACPVCQKNPKPNVNERAETERMAIGGAWYDHINGEEAFNIEDGRPFLEMTLAELGIPAFDILTAVAYEPDERTGRAHFVGELHYELTGDAALANIDPVGEAR